MLIEITEKNTWEEFPPLIQSGLFLQSWSQKCLYENQGQQTWLFEMPGRHGPIRSLVTKVSARRGKFLFLPYGPMILGSPREEDLQLFFENLREFAKKENVDFIRVSPFWEESAELRHFMKRLHFRPAPIHLLAETLWLLDIQEKSEMELFSGMEKKHRNLVRRAEKEGVRIQGSTSDKAVERFISLHQETVGRHRFTPYPNVYFKNQVNFFAKNQQLEVMEAWIENDLLASAIMMFYGNVAAYHHGASSSKPEHRKIPGSYLLQWEAIRLAKKRGLTQYNFWGIAPPDASQDHPFHGITHFKTGFGGRRIDLIPCHDLPLSPRYAVNWVVEKVRKWKRGF